MPAVPPPRSRRGFATTWWGMAWVEALETRARLDPNRLPRGRTYARHNHVERLGLEAGVVRAWVWGSRSTPYKVEVRVRTFSPTQWDTVVAAIASRAAHAAALLDGDLEPAILDDTRAAGVDLLPGPGDLQPRCSCPDWADPCKHSAAVCYLAAGLLDEDPFRLLELRGRPRADVLAALRRARAQESPGGGKAGADGGAARGSAKGGSAKGGAGGARGSAKGGGGVDGRAADGGAVPATAAWRRAPGPLPSPPAPASVPGHPAPWHADPPAGAEFTAAGLRTIVADAISRAHAMVIGAGPSWLGLDERADLARRAAATDISSTHPGETTRSVPEKGGGADGPVGGLAELARRAGRAGPQLLAEASAWRQAEADGLRVIDEDPWRPPTSTMVDARESLIAAGLPSNRIKVRQNRIAISASDELRLALDGRWYRFTKRGGRWVLSAPPADSADELLGAE